MPDTLRGDMTKTLKGITTAKEIFQSVEIRVVRPRITLF